MAVLSLCFLIPFPAVLGDGSESRCWGSSRGMVMAVRRHPPRGIDSPVSCLPFGSPLSRLAGREANTLANSFCSGNAAVCVSNRAGLLAQNCSAEARVGQRQIGHRQTMPPHAQRCQNVAEKHPENNHNFHLFCFITRRWFLFKF